MVHDIISYVVSWLSSLFKRLQVLKALKVVLVDFIGSSASWALSVSIDSWYLFAWVLYESSEHLDLISFDGSYDRR